MCVIFLTISLISLALLSGLYLALMTYWMRSYPHDRSRHQGWEDR